MVSVEHQYDPTNVETGQNPPGYTSLLYDPSTETVYTGENHKGIVKALTGSDEHNWRELGYAYGHHKAGPDGWVKWITDNVPPEVDQAVHETFGTRMDDAGEWKFAKEAPILPPGPANIREDAPAQDYGAADVNEAYAPRRAFVYHPDDHTVYVGGPGMHHGDVVKHYGLPWKPNKVEGVVQTGESRGFGAGPVGVRPVSIPHPDHQPIFDQLGEHYGLPVEDLHEHYKILDPSWQKPDDPWEFTGGDLSVKRADSEVDWAKEDRFGLGGSEAPQIHEHEFTPERMYDGDRRPFIYDEQNHAVHIGPAGAYHGELIGQVAQTTGEHIPYRNCGGVKVGLNNQPQEVYQYGGGVPQEILGHVEDHVGLGNDAAEWKFGSRKQASMLEWEPGVPGKGWVRDDGSIMTWQIDPQSKRPFHMDMHGKMKMEGRKPLYAKDDEGYTTDTGAFQIDPEGKVHRLGKELDAIFLQHIKREDPRLFNPFESEDQGWAFSA